MSAPALHTALDAATRARVQAGCNFVNAEVARLRKRVTTIGIAVFVAATIVWVITRGDPRLPFGAALLIAAFFANQARRELKRSYKGIVVRRLVAALGRGLRYNPESSLSRSIFESLDLFGESGDRYESEDQVIGLKGEVPYALHEVRVSRKERSSRNRLDLASSTSLVLGSGLLNAAQSARRYIFNGLVVQLDFNKNFRGHTVVVPEREGRILGGLFGDAESRGGKRIVRLENPDFEAMYATYSTDDQEARYLITPKLMELVIAAQALLGAELRLCFVMNRLFVTVPQKKDRFEVTLFGSPVTPDSALGDFVEVVNLAERLVDTLDLETRIWTRA